MTRWIDGSAIGAATSGDRKRWADEDRRWYADRDRRMTMTQKRTRYGLVERPPVTDDDDKTLDQWQGQIDSALDVAKKAEERETALKSTSTVDRERFPEPRTVPNHGGNR